MIIFIATVIGILTGILTGIFISERMFVKHLKEINQLHKNNRLNHIALNDDCWKAAMESILTKPLSKAVEDHKNKILHQAHAKIAIEVALKS